MKASRFFAIPLALVLAVPAFAGSGEKCSKSAQACLDAYGQYRDHGWLGIKYEPNETGALVVRSVDEKGPSAAAGFQVGDVLVAMNGIKMSDKEAMKKAWKTFKPGTQVTYTVSRNSAEQPIAVTLAPMPEEVFAAMVGEHMVHTHMSPAATVKAENPAK